MGVMGLLGGDHFFAGVQPASHPQRLEVGHCAPAAQMSQMIFPANHRGDFRHRFLLHRGTGPSAIKGMIIGIKAHG